MTIRIIFKNLESKQEDKYKIVGKSFKDFAVWFNFNLENLIKTHPEKLWKFTAVSEE